MSVQITNDGATIKIVNFGEVSNIPKANLKISTKDTFLILKEVTGEETKVNYTDIDVPSSGNLEDLRSQVESFLEDGGVGGGKSGNTSNTTSIASNIASIQLLAANSSRKKAVIVNDGSNTLYVKEGTAASVTSYAYKLSPEDSVIIDDYTGIIHGIWDVATGSARITETV